MSAPAGSCFRLLLASLCLAISGPLFSTESTFSDSFSSKTLTTSVHVWVLAFLAFLALPPPFVGWLRLGLVPLVAHFVCVLGFFNRPEVKLFIRFEFPYFFIFSSSPPLKFGMSRCCKPSALENCCNLSRPRGLVKISAVCRSVKTYTIQFHWKGLSHGQNGNAPQCAWSRRGRRGSSQVGYC